MYFVCFPLAKRHSEMCARTRRVCFSPVSVSASGVRRRTCIPRADTQTMSIKICTRVFTSGFIGDVLCMYSVPVIIIIINHIIIKEREGWCGRSAYRYLISSTSV